MPLAEFIMKLAPTFVGLLARVLRRSKPAVLEAIPEVKTPCLLVVEDNEISARLMHELIEYEGFTCIIVDTVTSAKALLATQNFPIMFLDMRLNGEFLTSTKSCTSCWFAAMPATSFLSGTVSISAAS